MLREGYLQRKDGLRNSSLGCKLARGKRMPQLEEILTQTVTPEQKEAYDRDGYVVIRGLVSPDSAGLICDDVVDIMAQLGSEQSKLRQTMRYLSGSSIDRLVNSRLLHSAACTLMGGPSSVYLPFTAYKSANGGGRFHFHQDNNYTHFDGPGINFWFAVTEMTEDNGCLQVVPGSHLSGTLESVESPDKDGHRTVTFEPEDFVSVLMQPGDCIAFTRNTVHGSGANITDKPRVGYAVQFYRDDVKAWRPGEPEYFLLKSRPRSEVLPVAYIVDPVGGPEDLDGH